MQAHSSSPPLSGEALSAELLDAYDAAIRSLSTVTDQSEIGRDTLAALRLQANLLRTIVGQPRLRFVPAAAGAS